MYELEGCERKKFECDKRLPEETVSDGSRPVQVRCERHAGGLSEPDPSIMQVMPRPIQRTNPASRVMADAFARRHSSERAATAAHELSGSRRGREEAVSKVGGRWSAGEPASGGLLNAHGRRWIPQRTARGHPCTDSLAQVGCLCRPSGCDHRSQCCGMQGGSPIRRIERRSVL